MRLRVVIVLGLSLLARPSSAGPSTPSKAAPKRGPNRVVDARPAPPRVFDGILGLLKNSILPLPFGSAPKGDGSEAALAVGSGKPPAPSGATAPPPARDSGTGLGLLGLGNKPRVKPNAGSPSDDDKLAFDENNTSPNADKANGAAQKGGGGGAPSDKGLEPIGLVYPVCVFVDSSPTVQSKANDAIKGMVDMAADCGVLILPFPVASTFPMGDDENAINEAQRKDCNIPQELGTNGKGSATSFVPWDDTAAKMCKDRKPDGSWNLDVAGCAEVRAAQGRDGKEDVGSSKERQDNFKKQLSEGGAQNSSSQSIAVSIEVPKGHNRVVISHEALGHSQMGRPNGKTLGLGIGKWGDDPQGEDESANGGWTKPDGCKALAENAFPNTKGYLYDRNRELYYAPHTDRIHIVGSRPIFDKGNRGPLPAIAQGPNPATSDTPSGGGSAGGQPGGQEAIVSRPVPPAVPKPAEKAAIADNVTIAPPKPSGRHDVKATGGVTLSELRQKNPPKEAPRDDSFAVVSQKSSGGSPTPFSSGGSREQLRIDETAGPNTAIAVVGSGGKSSGGGGSIFDTSSTGGTGGSFGSGGGGAKLGFDETMTAKGPTASVGGTSPPKLFLGKNSGGAAPTGGIDSALSSDFFSKVKFDEAETIRRRKPNADGRGRGIASVSAGTANDDAGEVRSLRR